MPRARKRPPRRVFGYDTQEAQIHLIRFKGKRRVIRPLKSEREAKKNYLEHRLFFELFPEHAIRPVGVASIEVGGEKKRGMVSEVVKNRSSDYKEFHKLFYSKSLKGEMPPTEEGNRHIDFSRDTANPIAQKITHETGFSIGRHPVNVCNVKGKPVFFEVQLYPSHGLFKAREYIVKNFAGEKRTSLLALWEQLRALPRNLPKK